MLESSRHPPHMLLGLPSHNLLYIPYLGVSLPCRILSLQRQIEVHQAERIKIIKRTEMLKLKLILII